MIEVNNLSVCRISKKFLQAVAERALKKENKKINLSIALVGQVKIKELNKRYRKKAKITDVLSFNYGDSGEVVICPEAVKRNARTNKTILKNELARVLTHGIWHILGYNHKEMSHLQNNG